MFGGPTLHMTHWHLLRRPASPLCTGFACISTLQLRWQPDECRREELRPAEMQLELMSHDTPLVDKFAYMDHLLRGMNPNIRNQFSSLGMRKAFPVWRR